MDEDSPEHILIQGGEWSFYQDMNGKWLWNVVFQDGKITSQAAFDKRVDAVEDARKRGYGRAQINI